MKPILKALFITLLLCLSTSCAVAPLSTLYTGRSVGKGVWSFTGGFVSNSGGGISGGAPVFKADYGAYENFDIGVVYELVNTGFIGKYSIINTKDTGFSWAGVLSAGTADGGGYWYLGSVASYKVGFFEPYGSLRFNRITRGTTNFSVTTIGAWVTPSNTFDYLYFTLGSAFWLSEKIGFSLEYNFFGTLNTSTTFPSPGYLAGGINYRL